MFYATKKTIELNDLLDLNFKVKEGDLSRISFDFAQPVINTCEFKDLEIDTKELIKSNIRKKFNNVLNDLLEDFNKLDDPISEITCLVKGE